MIQRFFAAFLLLSAVSAVNAQTHEQVISYQKGKLSFKQYLPNVVKVTYSPNGYTKNENISDAVILKQQATSAKLFTIKGDTIQVGNAHLIGTHQTNEFRGFHLALTNDEQIFGGGERALPLNRRGYKFNLYNGPWYGYSYGADNLNYSVPFFTSSNGYAIFFDNPSKGYVDIGKTNASVFEYGAFSGELNFYVISGSNYVQILRTYHQLTGTQPLPPRWALGNYMSRFGYTSEAQTNSIASTMEKENIPFDAIIFDLFWFGDSIKNGLGNLDWVNKQAWPNPDKMIANFAAKNRKTILITEPFVLEPTLNYNNGKKYLAVDSTGKLYTLTKFYFGKGGIIDVFREDTKSWFWQFYKKQMNKGVAGWWGDLGEPENHPADVYHNLKDFGFKRLFKADEVHNAFGHNWTKMLYQKFATDYPEKRLFSLNRSGFAGTQRYSIFPWSGDVSRSWSGFKAQLPVMLGMSMSGVPYIHADAGGFAGGEGSEELYIRWLQFAAFTPIFRPHGTALYEKDPAAYSFPSEPALFKEPVKSIARSIVQQRYAFLPYNYTLSYRQAQFGEPLVQPLYYQFNSDVVAAKVEDCYMWGNDLLVAPILEEGQRERTVYLPAGKWYLLNTNVALDGGKTHTVKAPLYEMPVFVKAGAIIPNAPVSNTIKTSEDFANDTTLLVHYYPSSTPTSYTLYEDDGSSKSAIATKHFELITFNAIPTKNGYSFSVKSNGGNYTGKPSKRKLQFIVHQNSIAPQRLFLNGKLMSEFTTGKTDFSFEISFDGKPLVLAVE